MKKQKIIFSLLACLILNATAFAVNTPKPSRQDDKTSAAIQAEISRDDALSGLNISAKTKNGLVTLEGAVKTQQQVDEAVKVTKSVPGVKKVNSLLRIEE